MIDKWTKGWKQFASNNCVLGPCFLENALRFYSYKFATIFFWIFCCTYWKTMWIDFGQALGYEIFNLNSLNTMTSYWLTSYWFTSINQRTWVRKEKHKIWRCNSQNISPPAIHIHGYDLPRQFISADMNCLVIWLGNSYLWIWIAIRQFKCFNLWTFPYNNCKLLSINL